MTNAQRLQDLERYIKMQQVIVAFSDQTEEEALEKIKQYVEEDL